MKHTVTLEIEFEDDISPEMVEELIKEHIPTQTVLEVVNLETELYEDVVIETLTISFPGDLGNA